MLNKTSVLRYQRKSQSTEIVELPQAAAGGNSREEYHLTAKDGDLHSQTMLLNGKILSVNSQGDIPPLLPSIVNSREAIVVDPLSIVFVHMPDVILPACS